MLESYRIHYTTGFIRTSTTHDDTIFQVKESNEQGKNKMRKSVSICVALRVHGKEQAYYQRINTELFWATY